MEKPSLTNSSRKSEWLNAQASARNPSALEKAAASQFEKLKNVRTAVEARPFRAA
jgi:hypothetical protein